MYNEVVRIFLLHICMHYPKCCIGNKEGNLSAALHNPAISGELLGETDSWYTEGATIDDIIERLQLAKCVQFLLAILFKVGLKV